MDPVSAGASLAASIATLAEVAVMLCNVAKTLIEYQKTLERLAKEVKTVEMHTKLLDNIIQSAPDDAPAASMKITVDGGKEVLAIKFFEEELKSVAAELGKLVNGLQRPRKRKSIPNWFARFTNGGEYLLKEAQIDSISGRMTKVQYNLMLVLVMALLQGQIKAGDTPAWTSELEKTVKTLQGLPTAVEDSINMQIEAAKDELRQLRVQQQSVDSASVSNIPEPACIECETLEDFAVRDDCVSVNNKDQFNESLDSGEVQPKQQLAVQFKQPPAETETKNKELTQTIPEEAKKEQNTYGACPNTASSSRSANNHSGPIKSFFSLDKSTARHPFEQRGLNMDAIPTNVRQRAISGGSLPDLASANRKLQTPANDSLLGGASTLADAGDPKSDDNGILRDLPVSALARAEFLANEDESESSYAHEGEAAEGGRCDESDEVSLPSFLGPFRDQTSPLKKSPSVIELGFEDKVGSEVRDTNGDSNGGKEGHRPIHDGCKKVVLLVCRCGYIASSDLGFDTCPKCTAWNIMTDRQLPEKIWHFVGDSVTNIFRE